MQAWARSTNGLQLTKSTTYKNAFLYRREHNDSKRRFCTGKWQEAAAHWQGIYAAFSDMDINPATVTADEKRIVAEIDFSGTNTGKMGEMPPTGKKFKLRGAFILDFNSDGKIEAIRTYYDPGGMMRQLGII